MSTLVAVLDWPPTWWAAAITAFVAITRRQFVNQNAERSGEDARASTTGGPHA